MRALSEGIHLLTPADYRRMPWKNGLGTTTQIAISPADAGLDGKAFEWRVSLAEIESDCGFSLFPGYDRTLMLAQGGGMELSFDSAPPQSLVQLHDISRFKGEWQTHCHLLNGPVQDFNVMTARAAMRHDCIIVTRSPYEFRDVRQGDTLLFYCFSGSMILECPRTAKLELAAHHTFILSHVLNGADWSGLVISAMTPDATAALVCMRPTNPATGRPLS